MYGSLSVITPCFNDFSNLQETLLSLSGELEAGDELILVDSSTDRARVPEMLEPFSFACAVRPLWVPAKGVFAAQNSGIVEAGSPWVQIMNSGDRLLPGARQRIRAALENDHQTLIHVFGQVARDEGGPCYTFRPTPTTLWPHQSVILARKVHDVLGLYQESLRYSADQVFLARARKEFPWRLHEEAVSDYLLGGISAEVSLRASRELYALWRSLDMGRARSCIRAFLSPAARGLAERVLGPARVARLKARVFGYYRR